jgi:hypothetical protein
MFFTTMGFFAVAAIGWYANRDQWRDSDEVPINVKHSRQDLRLVAYILFGILVMLGVIADRIH